MRATTLKGLAITPPVIGRISIGRIVEKQGKRLPEMDDQFTITTQVQDKDGGWRLHPIDDTLRQAGTGKLRTIPVRLMFNDPSLNFRAEYTMFDRKKARPVCMGNGEQCQRITTEGLQSLPCPSPDLCPLAEGGACKPYGRLNVLIGDDDATGSFIFRTTGFNSIRTLTARLNYLSGLSGGLLACLPLELKLRGKSTAQSYGRPIYYVDLVIRSGLAAEEAVSQARDLDVRRKACGYDQHGLDAAAQAGFDLGMFEDDDEDGASVVEEFFPEIGIYPTAAINPANTVEPDNATLPRPNRPVPLRDKLQAKATANAGAQQ
jgi:hypothetical protein